MVTKRSRGQKDKARDDEEEALRARLVTEAQSLAGDRSPALPVAVLLGEAIDLARFCERYWTSDRAPDGRLLVPGLELAGETLLPPMVADELLALERMVYEAHRERQLAVSEPEEELMKGARFVLSELTAALEWAFDDGVEDEWDVRLAKLGGEHEDSVSTQDGMALALEDYASLAEAALDKLKAVPAFEVQNIAEARRLAKALRERSAPSARPESAQLLEQRNRFAGLLQARMSRVRTAAQFVFRHHPEIAKIASSAYERRRRAEYRRRKGKGGGGEGQGEGEGGAKE